MLLRTRITLMVLVVSSVLILALAAEGSWKAGLAQDAMDQARLRGQNSAWTTLVRGTLQPLDQLVRTAARNGTVTATLAANDRAGLAQVVKAIQSEAGGLAVAAAVEVAAADGSQMLGTEAGDAILNKAVVAAAGRVAGPMAGLYYTAAGMPVLAVVAPLYSRTGLIGAIGVTIDPQPTIKELAAAVDADTVLSDANGAFPVASSARQQIAKAVFATRIEDRVFTLIEAGRRLQVTRTALAPAVAGPSAQLLSVVDVTESSRRSFWVAALSLVGVMAGAALSLAFLHWYMRRSFRPLYHVIHMLDALARGERSTQPIDVGGNDEIGRLAETAADFRKGLDARDQLLKLRQDIDAAHNIQRSILPESPPDRGEFAIKTYMHPARDVGGDFFDYFELPDGRFGFVIADVSGKGMGAALFMAVACTVIRSTARLVPDPGECLARANDLLAANNAESMFVSVFYGVYSPATGQVVYANGGHNPPYLVRSDGKIEPLPTTKGTVLAMFPGRVYATAELTLGPGECLYLYTDGVTEAQNDAGVLFGDDRLASALAGAEREPQHILTTVLDYVGRFVAEAPQADDITCMALQRRPEG